MVEVSFNSDFKKSFKKFKNNSLKNQIKKQIRKIIENPDIGKPMRYARKGTRELYVKPFRLSYAYFDDKLIFLNIYHKDSQ